MYAIRYGLDDNDPEQSQTLANLKTRVKTAAASDALAGGRVATISGLTQHYRDIGAYGDITPYNDSDGTFTPAHPPPPDPAMADRTLPTPTPSHPASVSGVWNEKTFRLRG